MSTSHTFIPLNNISTVIINEGLSRWNVRYYLAVVIRRGGGVVVALDVGDHFPAPDRDALTDRYRA
jgi:phosphatidylinositol glycan class H protein